MARIPTLAKRYYYYYTSPGLSTGAIVGISIAAILLIAIAIGTCARRARYGSYYGPSRYPVQQSMQPIQPQTYYPAPNGYQPVVPIYSTTSGNPVYPQTELGQVAPRAPDAAVIAPGGGLGGVRGGDGQQQQVSQPLPGYKGGLNGYYAPKMGAGK